MPNKSLSIALISFGFAVPCFAQDLMHCLHYEEDVTSNQVTTQELGVYSTAPGRFEYALEVQRGPIAGCGGFTLKPALQLQEAINAELYDGTPNGVFKSEHVSIFPMYRYLIHFEDDRPGGERIEFGKGECEIHLE
jgi:hypothetical protein